MSGFGIRALKKVKEEDSHISKKLYFKNIVIGDDSFAAIKYLDLVREYGEENVRLISQAPITLKTIENEWKCRINTIRSQEAADSLIAKNPRLEVFLNDNESVFYKDTKFHKFSGRAKPHELKEDEESFVNKSYYYNWKALFDSMENLDERLLKHQFNKFLEKIELTTPTDLVEKQNFRIETAENETFECENLYWCNNPKSFYKLVETKDLLDESVHQYCNQLESRTSLTINYICKGQVYEGEGTVFFPQSVTHEWGHFIADIKKFDPASQTQEVTSLMFIGEEIATEEELAKKIRLMNRVVERVLNDFSKVEKTECIQYRDDSFIKSTQDEFSTEMKTKHPHLTFVGEGAPLNLTEAGSINYLSRAILSL